MPSDDSDGGDRENFIVKYTTWDKEAEKGESHDSDTDKAFVKAVSRIEAINDILYDIRGVKSDKELARIHSIEKDGGGETSPSEGSQSEGSSVVNPVNAGGENAKTVEEIRKVLLDLNPYMLGRKLVEERDSPDGDARKYWEEIVGKTIQKLEGESSSTQPDSPNGNVTGSSAPKQGGEPPKTPWDDSRKVVVLNKKLQLAKRKIELAAISSDWSKAEEARDLLDEMIEVEPKP